MSIPYFPQVDINKQLTTEDLAALAYAVKELSDTPPPTIANVLVTDGAITPTLQAVKGDNNTSTALQLASDKAKVVGDFTVAETLTVEESLTVAETITVGSSGSSNGAITLLGTGAGVSVYDRNYPSFGNFWVAYSSNGIYRIYAGGGLNTDVLSIAGASGVGQFLNGQVLANKTTAEILAMTPTKGLVFMNSTINKICFYDGTSWQQVVSGSMT